MTRRIVDFKILRVSGRLEETRKNAILEFFRVREAVTSIIAVSSILLVGIWGVIQV